MKSKGLFGTVSLIAVGIVFGAILVSGFGWDRPSMADVQIGNDSPPVEQVNLDAVAFNNAFVEVAEKVTPSIVRIKVVATAKSRGQNNPFRFFFDHPDIPQQERKQQGGGSGVIISKDGYIITNNHVVDNATSVTVELSTRETYHATVIGTDPMTDIAVIKIEADDLPAVYFGDSDEVKVGQWIMAIGNPLSYLTSTVTAGIVSAQGRNLNLIDDHRTGYGIENFIQTDAAINPGNSGGAMVDLTGALVGINTAIATNGFSSSYIGYGFAIPVNLARSVAEDLITHGTVRRGYIGIRIAEVDASMAKAVGLDKPQGVLVNNIVEGGSAAESDLEAGDIILTVDDIEVNQPNELQSIVAQRRAGDEVKLVVFRDGESFTRYITLKAPDDDSTVELAKDDKPKKEEKEVEKIEVKFDELGLSLRNMTIAEKEKFAVQDGVIITDVEDYSEAYSQRLGRGLVITEVNKTKVNNVNDIEEIFSENEGKAVLLKVVYSSGDVTFVGLEIPGK